MRHFRSFHPRQIGRKVAVSVASFALAPGAVAGVASAHGDALPPGYAYELVSPPFSLGQTVGTQVVSDDGAQALLSSAGAIEDAGNAPGLGGLFHARRTAEGWRTSPLIPAASAYSSWQIGVISDFGLDARTALFSLQRPAERNTMTFTPVRSDADGQIEVAGPTIDDSGAGGLSLTVGTSADLRTLVIRSRRRVISTDGAPDTRSASREGLYVSRPDPDIPGGFMVRQVAFRGGASMGASACDALLGSARTARGAVSSDGQRIFFTLFSASSACSSVGVNLPINHRVWLREGAGEPEDLSASLCTVSCGAAAPAYFEGASFDGRRVYFTTEQKLLNGDQDDTDRSDLYVHDSAFAAGNRLKNVTSGGGTGQGAGVRGVVRVSDDGSYVYFVANGRALAGANAQGDTPQSGNSNLYVYHRPRSPLGAPATIKFIGQLDPADLVVGGQSRSLFDAQNRPVSTSSDGRYFLFAAYSDLTGDKQPGDALRDLYRYDAVSGELLRIWSPEPAHNGAARTAGIWPDTMVQNETTVDGARQKERRRGWMISDDGRTVGFSTAEPLSPNDANDKRDAYMWQEETGAITMLSDGRSARDLDVSRVSPSGDVFFATDAPLVPQHRSGALATFVARQGGGFAPPPDPTDPCAGDTCQGSVGAPTVAMGDSLTGGFAGMGNLPAPMVQLTASAAKSVRGSRVAVRVQATGDGRMEVRGSRLTAVSRSLTAGRRTSVAVKLSTLGRRALARGQSVRTTLRVRVYSTDGAEATRRIKVTFRPTVAQVRKARTTSRSGQAR